MAPGAGEVPGAGDGLLHGARARTVQAAQVAARARALARPTEPWPSDVVEPVAATRRWAVSWRAGVVAAAALLALGGVVVLRSLGGGPEILVSTAQATLDGGGRGDLSSTGAVQPAPSEDPAGHSGPSAVTVHVVGAVTAPGVVSLPVGARAVDAVRAAGGASPDADLARVNLAHVLADGEQIVVPTVGEPGAAGAAGGDGTTAGGALDLNGADVAALESLPRIGPVLAERIVAWRTSHGRFSSVDELAEVPGIGPALLAALDGLVRV